MTMWCPYPSTSPRESSTGVAPLSRSAAPSTGEAPDNNTTGARGQSWRGSCWGTSSCRGSTAGSRHQSRILASPENHCNRIVRIFFTLSWLIDGRVMKFAFIDKCEGNGGRINWLKKGGSGPATLKISKSSSNTCSPWGPVRWTHQSYQFWP